ncbi:MAG: hypothetical protein H0X17_02220 [Deltaproteobacteria bacterium]|nr:hypothetical protein [Deltaproteobacteria bacterium]
MAKHVIRGACVAALALLVVAVAPRATAAPGPDAHEDAELDDEDAALEDGELRSHPGAPPAGALRASLPDLAIAPRGRITEYPAIGEVLAAAYAAAGLDHDPTRGWARRTRIAGLIPWVTVRSGWDTSWKEDRPDIGRSRTFEVRATWRLDRLLFDGRELQVAGVDAARRRERRRLGSRVIRAYFGWRRVAAAAGANPRWTGRAEEAAAELDVLTDGWFTEELARPRRTASEIRTP